MELKTDQNTANDLSKIAKNKKDELKNSLNETIKKLVANSKDAHFANSLIDKMLSLKGQLGINPTIVMREYKNVIGEIYYNGVTATIGTDFVVIHYAGTDVVINNNFERSNTIVKSFQALYSLHVSENRDVHENYLYDVLKNSMMYCYFYPSMMISDYDCLIKYDTECTRILNAMTVQEGLNEYDITEDEIAVALNTPYDIDMKLGMIQNIILKPITPYHVHFNNWVEKMKADGWSYGALYDKDSKTSPMIREFNELSPNQINEVRMTYDFAFAMLSKCNVKEVVMDLQEEDGAANENFKIGNGI